MHKSKSLNCVYTTRLNSPFSYYPLSFSSSSLLAQATWWMKELLCWLSGVKATAVITGHFGWSGIWLRNSSSLFLKSSLSHFVISPNSLWSSLNILGPKTWKLFSLIVLILCTLLVCLGTLQILPLLSFSFPSTPQFGTRPSKISQVYIILFLIVQCVCSTLVPDPAPSDKRSPVNVVQTSVMWPIKDPGDWHTWHVSA